MKRWRDANDIANCRCDSGGRVIGRAPSMFADLLLDWTCRYEYWNTPWAGHLIAASLALDGLACEDLP